MAGAPLLHVAHLVTGFDGPGGFTPVVRDVSFGIARGETLALVGESGSGKSLTALSIVGLVTPPGRIRSGQVLFEGTDLTALGDAALQQVRGRRIGFVFQEPMTALNPVFTIGDQLVETLGVHNIARGGAARATAVNLLRDVAIPDPERRFDEYPHQLSGGLRQRALIAMALACGPGLLIADEPTSALDVTIQADLLGLLRELKARHDLAMLLITHDFGVVAHNADRVAVMYAGQIVEEAPVRALFSAPAHPYTRALLASMPGATPRGQRLAAIPGTVPLPADFGTACAFAPRCPSRFQPCDRDMPGLLDVSPAHAARCFLYGPEHPAVTSGTPAASSAPGHAGRGPGPRQ
jgi:oligopeptide/dipeptide ABC transporter ATP-binding protein